MKITLESTDQLITLEVNGTDVPARIWEGRTESGVPVHCYITRVCVPKTADPEHIAEFERELVEQRVPRQPSVTIPMRLIL